MKIRELEVTVTRRIKVGGNYRINGSYGFAGILDGMVQVIDIIDFNDLPDDVDKDVWLDDGDWVAEEPWIVYEYLHEEDEVEQYLPLTWFKEHISVV